MTTAVIPAGVMEKSSAVMDANIPSISYASILLWIKVTCRTSGIATSASTVIIRLLARTRAFSAPYLTT